ncbi:MAG: MATE family efflux transporter [Clostridia bacterium]
MIKIKDRDFYKTLLVIAVPCALQNLITIAVSLADTIMIGSLGQSPLSAVTLASQIGFLFYMFSLGISGGVTAMIPQYWGVKNITAIKKVFSLVLKITALLSIIFFTVSFFLSKQLLSIFTKDIELINIGSDYLQIFAFTFLVYGFTTVLMVSFRAVETTRISLIISISTLFVNVFLNWVLIFGNLGFPALGAKGAAIATLIARIIEFIIMTIYLFFIDKKIKFKLYDLLNHDIAIFKKFISYGSPVIINECMWSLAITFQTVVFGRLGADAVAANSIMSVVSQLSTVVMFGVANAAAVIIGKTIGQENVMLAQQRAKKVKIISIILGILCCIVVLLIKDIFVDFYNIPDTTKELARNLMSANAFLLLFISPSAMFIIGILRGGGDTKFALKIELSSLWLVSIPLAAIFGLYLNFPVVIVFLLMKLDEPIKAIGCFIRTRNSKWIKDITKS